MSPLAELFIQAMLRMPARVRKLQPTLDKRRTFISVAATEWYAGAFTAVALMIMSERTKNVTAILLLHTTVNLRFQACHKHTHK